jgi:hypothetical protein
MATQRGHEVGPYSAPNWRPKIGVRLLEISLLQAQSLDFTARQ